VTHRWSIIYGDHSIFTNEDGTWEEAPGRDCQVILFWDNDLGNWAVRHGAFGRSVCDFFRIEEDGFVVGMDLSGMIDHVVYELGIATPDEGLVTIIHRAVHELGIVKQGKMLSRRKWDDVLRFAMMKVDELRIRDGNG